MHLRPRSLGSFKICPMVVGMWQVSGAHGKIDPKKAIPEMVKYAELGFTTFDLADHYGPAEDFIGEFRQQYAAKHGKEKLDQIQAFTKWVPHPGKMTRATTEEAINVSLKRMQTSCLDLLQFHWWDYSDNEYLNALRHLHELQKEGKIRHLALTNFDTDHLKIILDAGIPIVSNQVSYSMVDRRPEQKMIPLCRERGVKLLTYGTLLGGFLSEKWIGVPNPDRLETVSQKKYKRFIDQWGSWSLFQELLQTAKSIADKHRVSVANVACRYVLDKPEVAGVLVGARLGIAEHIADNEKVDSFTLDEEDYKKLLSVLNRGKMLPGDCGDEYRG